jgi:feruloyl esterase
MLSALFIAASALSIDAATCESLKSLSLPDTTILSATLVPAGPFTLPAATPTQKPQVFQIPVDACRIAGVVKPAVNFEVWMPASFAKASEPKVSGWNGKFQGVGNGGFAGVITYGAIATALGRGYAVASTDTGHNTPGGSWAMGHPELVIDFGYRAIHEMTVKSKEIVKAFYGNAPARSYFVGCSTGGRQGLSEAQRFPVDYDGIVAGAPANYYTHMHAGSVWIAAATLKEKAARLSPAKFAALNKGAIAACDATDGVTDGLIENPAACRFDPSSLRCTGAESDACLTTPQIEAARKIYGTSTNPRTKAVIFPGMAPGSELTWGAKAAQPLGLMLDMYKYLVFSNPGWDWKTFDFDKDVAAGDDKVGKIMNAIDPDLRAFKKGGGKLILYHGWNDQLISPYNTINYYGSVTTTMGPRDTDDFARLFMVPGMQHCAGGVGPNVFDSVTALEQWVEKGTKPAQIVASHMSDGLPTVALAKVGTADRTRPLCPYPQVASYKGSGSINEAASFVCK